MALKCPFPPPEMEKDEGSRKQKPPPVERISFLCSGRRLYPWPSNIFRLRTLRKELTLRNL